MTTMTQELFQILEHYGPDYAKEEIMATSAQLLPRELGKLESIYQMLVSAAAVMPNSISTAQRVRLLYEGLRRGICYKKDDDENSPVFTYVGALAGEAVCMGIAELFYLCCLAACIKSEVVVGSIKGKTDSLHAWNRVYVAPGQSYFCDLTWDLRSPTPRYFLKGSDCFLSRGHLYREDQYAGVAHEDHPPVLLPDNALDIYADAFKALVFDRYSSMKGGENG